jgi:hypothetical protein
MRTIIRAKLYALDMPLANNAATMTSWLPAQPPPGHERLAFPELHNDKVSIQSPHAGLDEPRWFGMLADVFSG